MKQSVGTVAATGKPLKGLDRPQGQNIRFSQTITLGCPKIASIARPGQFVMVNCGPDCTLPRPFSVHQVIDKERLVLYFAVLEDGKGTDWLSNRRKGDAVSLFGPLGNGFSVQPSSHNLLLVAGGIGVAPLHFLAEETLKNGHSVTMLYGTADETSYPEALPRLELVRATEDGSVGHHGMVTDLLPKLAGWGRPNIRLRAHADVSSDVPDAGATNQTGTGFSGNRHGLRSGSLLRLHHQNEARTEEGLSTRSGI